MKFSPIIRPKKLEWDEKTLTSSYGKFIAEPFERGYGHTIGNSLRRVLLSSVEGAAVTNVKIEGVYHECSMIPGIVEDVSEILLNLKRLCLRLYTQGPEQLRLKVEKEGEIRASDIEPNNNIEIINPDIHIATLGGPGMLEMVMEVNMGRGYMPVERIKKSEHPIGVIYIDSIFTPIERVKYEVENTRVGQIMDYDRLIMEIWTNGAIIPQDALAYTSKILKDSLTIFITFDEEEQEQEDYRTDEEETEKNKKLKDLLSQSVEIIELSVRSLNCLRDARIKILGDLVKKSQHDLLKMKNFGKKSLTEIGKKLEEMGLSLGMQLPK